MVAGLPDVIISPLSPSPSPSLAPAIASHSSRSAGETFAPPVVEDSYVHKSSAKACGR
jgi:hypothetical protein